MSNIVWDAENGWHDGPECDVRLINGRFYVCPVHLTCDTSNCFLCVEVDDDGW